MPTVAPVSPPSDSQPAPIPTQAAPSPPEKVREPGLIFLARADGISFTQCVYSRGGNGQRQLVGVVVGPPVPLRNADYAADSELRASRWHFELQVNALEQIFNADWETVATSPRQRVSMQGWDPVFPRPVTLGYDSRHDGTTAVYRVVIVVDWLGRRDRVLDTQRVVGTSYAPRNVVGAAVPEGCHAVDLAGAEQTD